MKYKFNVEGYKAHMICHSLSGTCTLIKTTLISTEEGFFSLALCLAFTVLQAA